LIVPSKTSPAVVSICTVWVSPAAAGPSRVKVPVATV
jgi:hypothetical protein